MAFRFQKFNVYIDAKKLIKEIFVLTKGFPKEEQFGLISQLRRAAISVALNIAEGSDRGSVGQKILCAYTRSSRKPGKTIKQFQQKT